jgi:hypothetical protein
MNLAIRMEFVLEMTLVFAIQDIMEINVKVTIAVMFHIMLQMLVQGLEIVLLQILVSVKLVTPYPIVPVTIAMEPSAHLPMFAPNLENVLHLISVNAILVILEVNVKISNVLVSIKQTLQDVPITDLALVLTFANVPLDMEETNVIWATRTLVMDLMQLIQMLVMDMGIVFQIIIVLVLMDIMDWIAPFINVLVWTQQIMELFVEDMEIALLSIIALVSLDGLAKLVILVVQTVYKETSLEWFSSFLEFFLFSNKSFL